jgi:hypothetical protein
LPQLGPLRLDVASQAARCERLSFAYFSLPQQRKVGAAPHRGNACAARRIADASEKAKKPTPHRR